MVSAREYMARSLVEYVEETSEEPKLDNERRRRGIFAIDPEDLEMI